MASDLLSIGLSGAKAARAALDLTSQNIANAGTTGYVRRTLQLEEMAGASGSASPASSSLSGVRIGGVVRNADAFRQGEVRRTGSDAARASAEVAGLEGMEAAIEQAGVYPAVVQFEAALQKLAADPVNPSLRAATVENARTMATTFTIAAAGLDAAGTGLRTAATDGVARINLVASELSKVNLRLARTADASNDQSVLLDQRDQLLEQLSGYTDVSTTIAANQTVEVRLGGTAGPALVSGGTAATLAMDAAPEGTIAFSLGGDTITPTGGSLAGQALALGKLVDVHAGLDTIAASVIAALNSAQAGGVTLDGTAGQPMFGGSDAKSIAVGLQGGAQLATAPAGAGANSRDPGNLTTLRSTLAAVDPAGRTDALLFDISSAVAGRTITRDALATIATTARTALSAQAGVDLDQEAVNLVRFQQAFQASGRAMQVASDIFDTLLALK